VVLPGIVLTVLILLPWLKRARLIGASLLGAGVVVVLLMTTAAYLSDRRNQRTREQLSKQVAEEEAWRREPFEPARLTLANSASTTAQAAPGGPPVLYIKFCVNCHGEHGEGARQGKLNFPPLLDVSAKPRRTVDDIVGLLKDPTAYGLEPPMAALLGMLTGIGGGMARDIMLTQIPTVLRAELYAVAALAGGRSLIAAAERQLRQGREW